MAAQQFKKEANQSLIVEKSSINQKYQQETHKMKTKDNLMINLVLAQLLYWVDMAIN